MSISCFASNYLFSFRIRLFPFRAWFVLVGQCFPARPMHPKFPHEVFPPKKYKQTQKSHLIGVRNVRMEKKIEKGRRWTYISWKKQLTKSEISDCEKQMKTAEKLKTIEAWPRPQPTAKWGAEWSAGGHWYGYTERKGC